MNTQSAKIITEDIFKVIGLEETALPRITAREGLGYENFRGGVRQFEPACFVMKGQRRKNRKAQIVPMQPAPVERYRAEATWRTLGNVISGLVFAAVIVWAVPTGLARTAAEVSRVLPAGVNLPVRESFAGPLRARMPFPGEIDNAYINPDADREYDGGMPAAELTARDVSGAIDEYSIIVPSYIAAEIEAEDGRMPRSGYGSLPNGGASDDAISDISDEEAGEAGDGPRLTGIMCLADGKCAAIINREIFVEGDMLDGNTQIERIERRRVVLRDINDPGARYTVGI